MTVPVLPDGTILLHIGPHKTGTTAIQFAAGTRRDRLAAARVYMPGSITHHSPAAMSVGERGWGWEGRGGRGPQPERWHQLLDQVAKAPDGFKVFLTSEFFGELQEQQMERALNDLGRERVHVVVTLRPLTKILPSSWQQYLKSGATRPYGTWLEAVLADPPDEKITPTFWRRQDHGALVEKWSKAVGPENLTVIVLDDKDHGMLPAAFEALLGLEAGDLSPAPGQRVNRSMTAAECEFIRRTNGFVSNAEVGWPNFEQIVRNGAVVRMVENRVPAKDEAKLVLPHWAAVRAAEIGEQASKRIETTGVRVVGDLARLHPDAGPAPEPEDDAPTEPPETITIDAAVDALVGSVSGSLGKGAFLAKERTHQARVVPPGESDRMHVGDLQVREATTAELVKTVRNRVRSRAKRALKRN